MNRVPPGAGRGLRFHLEAGDLDAMDGLLIDRDDANVVNVDLFALGPYLPAAARIGLNETPLTRAMASGQFALAEELVQVAVDPEYLNDGAHAATPMTLALRGRSASYSGQPRNLKLAKLLAEKGANVNLRIPNHDLETASESPLELLTTFYLSLLKIFPGGQETNGEERSSMATRRQREYIEMDLLDTIGLNDEEKMSPQTLTAQARELLYFFLDHGADINLQTTDAGRTVFHSVLAGDVTDQALIEHMVSLGALVNLTDVHGSTPLMDVIRCKEKGRGVEAYKMLEHMGKRLLLDAQNCSGESALFRSMHQGKMDMTFLLLDEGAASFIMARVQEEIHKRPLGRFTAYLHHRPSISNLPTLLAPLLGDSPCLRSVARHLGLTKRFSVVLFNEVMRAKVAPFVDLGWFCTREVEKTVHALLRAHTHFRHLTEDKVFQEIALIPLLFGHLSAGLRQRCIREILHRVIFTQEGDKAPMIVTLFKKRPGRRSRDKQPRSSSAPKESEWRDLGQDSACVIPSVASNDSSHGSTRSEQISRAVGDNWLLKESPSYQNHRVCRSSEGIELEISRHEEDDGNDRDDTGEDAVSEVRAELHQHSTPATDRLLEEANRALESIQLDVDAAHHQVGEATSQDSGQTLENVEDLTLGTTGVMATTEEPGQEDTVEEPRRRHSPVIVELQQGAASASSASRIPPSHLNESSPSSFLVSSSTSSTNSNSSDIFSDEEEEEEDEDADDESWGGAFSLSHSLYQCPNTSSATGPNHETIIKMFTPEKVLRLSQEIGLPPGLLHCLELEIARLQLGLAVFRHRTIDCDRGCEGDDSISSSDTDSSWGPDSLSEPSLTLSESDLHSLSSPDNDVAENIYWGEQQSYEPAVPAFPRMFSESSSSSSSSSSEDAPEEVSHTRSRGSSWRHSRPDQELGIEDIPEEDKNDGEIPLVVEDWFTFGGEEEQESVRRYVRRQMAEGFEASTDSSTSEDEAEEVKSGEGLDSSS